MIAVVWCYVFFVATVAVVATAATAVAWSAGSDVAPDAVGGIPVAVVQEFARLDCGGDYC